MLKEITNYITPFFKYIGLAGVLIGTVGALSILSIFIYFRRRLNPYRRAVKWYEKGHPARAFMFLEVALGKNPANKQALLMKADIQSDRGEYLDAEKSYFRLLDLKEPGDGIDVSEVKLRLIKPLFCQEKLYDTFKLAEKILSNEPSNAEALYYLGLIYLGQLYYREAYKILSYLIKNRTRFHEALFACAVTAVQLKELDAALRYIRRALAVDKDPLYTLVLACIHFFRGTCSECLAALGTISSAEKSFEKKEQYRFYLRLEAFCHYLKGDFDLAVGKFRALYSMQADSFEKKEPVKKGPGIYDEFGRIGKTEVNEEKNRTTTSNSMFQKYYRLKEVSIETGKRDQLIHGSFSWTSTLLDVEGLSDKTWAALNVGFSIVKSGKLEEALGFFKEIKAQHPEVLGLNRLIGLIDEIIQEKPEGGIRNKVFPIERSTKKIISNKKGRFELWEYIAAWKNTVVRLYQLLSICGFTARKQLSPGVLFRNDGPVSWLLK